MLKSIVSFIKSIFSSKTMKIKSELVIGNKKEVRENSHNTTNNFSGNSGTFGDVTIGLSYEATKDLATMTAQKVVTELAVPIAKEQAKQSVEQLANKLFEKYDNEQGKLIEAFKNPAFNNTFTEATKSFISSDSSATTEEILINILANRVENKNTSINHLITSKAIFAADKISDNELRNLAASFVIIRLSNEINNYNDFKDNWLLCFREVAQYFYPQKQKDWLQNMELIDVVKINQGFVNKFDDFLFNQSREVLTKENITKDTMVKDLEQYPMYSIIKEWWNHSVNVSFSFTKVGDTIAFLEVTKKMSIRNVKNLDELFASWSN